MVTIRFISKIKTYSIKKLSEIILTVLETDKPLYATSPVSKGMMLKKLLAVISNSAPLKSNLSAISGRTGISSKYVEKLFILVQ